MYIHITSLSLSLSLSLYVCMHIPDLSVSLSLCMHLCMEPPLLWPLHAYTFTLAPRANLLAQPPAEEVGRREYGVRV